ncbi:MAG: hypothetical protein KBA26_11960, partial [Candidatus Delongbacteria bacterium]|nr:hypothetical protein [Candidatus Delongbacteria bacterium]
GWIDDHFHKISLLKSMWIAGSDRADRLSEMKGLSYPFNFTLPITHSIGIPLLGYFSRHEML